MFRLLELSLNDENHLGHIPADKLIFVPEKEISADNCILPYTTVLIGPNGTGKSTLLSYIAKIFEDINYVNNNKKRNPNGINFQYSIKYKIDDEVIRITHKKVGFELEAFKEGSARFLWKYFLKLNDNKVEDVWELPKIKVPNNILAVCYLPMDRFRQKSNLPKDFYQYLGLRLRNNLAGTQSFLNSTLPLLFNYIAENNDFSFLSGLLEYMNLSKDFLGIKLVYRYKQHFFNGNLTEKLFIDFFENQEKYTARKTKSYGKNYFEKYIKEDSQLISRLVSYLNYRSFSDALFNGTQSFLELNLLEKSEVVEELSLVRHLQKLDLLSSANLTFRRNKQYIETADLSSGEFHFLTTMIAIQSTIRENSLILIDEPETSFHPNWQMKYVHYLKDIFKAFRSCHFILATHSHFIVSDLENESSEIVSLKGILPKIEINSLDYQTFGWSTDEVLYKVFEVRNTRNHFFKMDLLRLGEQLNSEIKDIVLIKQLIENLSKYQFSEDDPLTKLIKVAESYIVK